MAIAQAKLSAYAGNMQLNALPRNEFPTYRPEQRPLIPNSGHEVRQGVASISAVLLYGNGNSDAQTQVFKMDCENLEKTLLDDRVAGASSDNIKIVSKETVQRTFLSFKMQWEEEVLRNATTLSVWEGRDTWPAEVVEQAIWAAHTKVRIEHAYSIITKLIGKYRRVSLTEPEKIRVRSILEIVKMRWTTLKNFNLTTRDKKSELLISICGLWTGEAIRFADDYGLRDLNSLIPTIMVHEEAMMREKEAAIGDFNESLKRDADLYFTVFLWSSGIPIASNNLSEELYVSLLADLVTAVLPVLNISQRRMEVKDLKNVALIIVSSFRRLRNRSLWFHYSGHHDTDGTEGHRSIPMLSEMLHAACRTLANVVVTLDCCYADSFLNPMDFHVESMGHSGCTVIAACTSDRKAPYPGIFTDLIIAALRCAPVNCRYGIRDKACPECRELRSRASTKGYIYISDVFTYVHGHLEQLTLRATISEHASFPQLPVAFHQNESKCFVILLFKLHGNREFSHSFDLDTLEPDLDQIMYQILMLTLKIFIDKRHEGKTIARMLACPLFGCHDNYHREGLTYQECITRAYVILRNNAGSVDFRTPDNLRTGIQEIFDHARLLFVVSSDQDAEDVIFNTEKLQATFRSSSFVYCTIRDLVDTL